MGTLHPLGRKKKKKRRRRRKDNIN